MKQSSAKLPQISITPIIKIVGDFCNLRCGYCFYSQYDQTYTCLMNEQLLEKFIREFLTTIKGRVMFIWHGGEPLLAGLDFFEKIIAFQTQWKNDHIIRNAVQTNATLITKSWCLFFQKHQFGVGVSLDGDKESHNLFRKMPNGQGSFRATQQGINLLRSYGLQPGLIQTITKDHIQNSSRIFQFFTKTLGVKSWGLNFFLDLQNEIDLHKQQIANAMMVDFLKNYIDLWLAADQPDLMIREIEDLMAGLLGLRASNCSFNGSCGMYLCLNYDGLIYPCDRFSKDGRFVWGDLSRQSLREILFSPHRLQYINDVSALPTDCLNCNWRFACHNGCTHHRVGGIAGKYFFCEARKIIFDYLQKRVISLQERRNQ